MNYSRFGAFVNYNQRKRSESASATIQKPWCGVTVCVQRKSLCVHFDVRKNASNVICNIHERPTNVCILPGF